MKSDLAGLQMMTRSDELSIVCIEINWRNEFESISCVLLQSQFGVEILIEISPKDG